MAEGHRAECFQSVPRKGRLPTTRSRCAVGWRLPCPRSMYFGEWLFVAGGLRPGGTVLRLRRDLGAHPALEHGY